MFIRRKYAHLFQIRLLHCYERNTKVLLHAKQLRCCFAMISHKALLPWHIRSPFSMVKQMMQPLCHDKPDDHVTMINYIAVLPWQTTRPFCYKTVRSFFQNIRLISMKNHMTLLSNTYNHHTPLLLTFNAMPLMFGAYLLPLSPRMLICLAFQCHTMTVQSFDPVTT